MPKKSKREKILADYRRKIQTQQSLTVHLPTLVKEETSLNFQFKLKNEPQTPIRQSSAQDVTELVAIKRDLSKTFILATLAIAAELIIYWFGKGKL
jgi:acyl-CoA thioesterase FadM